MRSFRGNHILDSLLFTVFHLSSCRIVRCVVVRSFVQVSDSVVLRQGCGNVQNQIWNQSGWSRFVIVGTHIFNS